ncbi:hypothetical protein BJF78_19085 [Pseudonocardia sp. CNS-139]|nr:hypothetical protein BJF78_19085 [Pseudonocardia sp. CNS-139]
MTHTPTPSPRYPVSARTCSVYRVSGAAPSAAGTSTSGRATFANARGWKPAERAEPAGRVRTSNIAPSTASAVPVVWARSSGAPECGEPTASHHQSPAGVVPYRRRSTTSPSAAAPPPGPSSSADRPQANAASAVPPASSPAATSVRRRSSRPTAMPASR